MHYLRQAACKMVEEEHDEIRKRGESDSEDREMSKERELGPKLGCNYSRLPCKLSSCHSYLSCWI